MTELNPYAPPAVDVDSARPETRYAFWREGDALVATRGEGVVVLPDRCVRCNAPAGGFRLRRTVYWHAPAYYLLIVVSVLLYAIVALIVRKSVKLEVGLCEAHRKRRRLGLILLAAGLLSPLVFAFTYDWLGRAIVPLMVLCMLGGVIAGAVLSRVLHARRIDASRAWLKVGAPFLVSIGARPSGR